MERVEIEMPAGQTLLEILTIACGDGALLRHAHVFIEDRPIPREYWRVVRPNPGTHITIRVVPRGGGGKKNPLATILMLVVIVASAVFAPYLVPAEIAALGAGATAAATAAIAAGLTLVGTVIVNAIAPPQRPKLGDLSGRNERTSPTLSITGAQNRANPYGPIPRVFGRHRMFAPLAAAQFTEVVGNDQYLRCLFDFGYGPLVLSDHRIGTTPIAQFQGVEMEVRQGYDSDAPITLYSNQVVEDVHQIKLAQASGAQLLESRDDADEVTADLTFGGLVDFDEQGNRGSRTVQVRVEHRRAGTADPFVAIRDEETLVASSAAPAFSVPNGQVFADYRTAEPVQGPVTVALARTFTFTVQDGEQIVTYFGWRWRLWVRMEGDAGFVAHYETPSGQEREQQTVALIGQSGRKMEIRVEKVATDDAAYNGTVNAGGAPSFPAPGFSYSAIANTDFLSITGATEQAVRRTARIRPAAKGRIEIRFTRLTADTTDPTIRDECFITALRTIRFTPPVNAKGHGLVALRIRATNQLQGTIQSYNAIAEAMLPAWTGSAFTAPQLTRNPAWAALEVLRGKGNKKALADSRIDLPAWLDLAQANDAADQSGEPSFRFDAVLDARSTVREAAGDILATCRAALGFKDGKYTVVRDKPQSVPVQAFSPRNSWGFRATKIFVQRPHALKVRFINPAKDWSQDEVIVYDDGFDKGNATLFETMEMFGVTRPAQAWREGKRRMAESKLRPEVYRLNADVESLVCRRGDLVAVAHDVPRWGLMQGRLKSLVADGGGNVTQITLDELMTLEAGKLYAVKVRRSNLAVVLASVATPGVTTETGTLNLATPIPAASAPAAGDLVFFGEAERVTVDLVLKGIRRLRDLAAELELVDAAPALHAVDAGPLPAFDTQSTFPGQGVNLNPAKPLIEDVRSDEDAMIELPGGGWQTAIRFTFAARSGTAIPVEFLEVQSRAAGTAGPWDSQRLEPLPVVYATGFDQGATLDLRLRYVTAAGRASDWAPIAAHLVRGKTTPPPDVPQVFLNGAEMTWTYPAARPRDFAGFKVLYNLGFLRQRAGATSAHEGVLGNSKFNISQLPRGTVTFLVVAVDDSGNESVNPAILIKDLGDPLVDNVIDAVDLKAQGFPGTIANGALAGGNLQANDDGALYLASAAAAYLPDGDALYLPLRFLEMAWETTVVPDSDDVPSTMTLLPAIAGDTWSIELRNPASGLYLPDGAALYLPDGAAPYLGESQGAYIPWPGALETARQPYQFRVRTAAGNVRGMVSGFTVQLDVPDEGEIIEDLALPAGGARLPIAKIYRSIRHVSPTLQFDGGTARTVRVLDFDAKLGPLLRAYDGADAGTTALIDATVQGVKG